MSLYDDIINSKQDNYNAFFGAMTRKTRSKKVLNSALLELTPVCNFTCPFCYARMSPEQLKERGERIMRFEDWKPIIDQLAEMNVGYITLTGGECTLHPDFKEIYRYCYSKNFEIYIMSNGSNITDEILNLFCECPPQYMFVTIYGGSPETYKTVTGSAANYDKVINNVKRLNERGINVSVQTTICKDNVDDFTKIHALSEQLGVPLRFNKDFFEFRTCDSDAIETNQITEMKFKKILEETYGKPKYDKDTCIRFTKDETTEKGMTCGAGRANCAFNYKGQMVPCVTFDFIKIDTKDRKLSDCWQELVAACDEIPRIVECKNCIFRDKCRSCMALHYYDAGEFGKPSPNLCFKKIYPEKAKEIEKFYEENGFVYAYMYDF